MNRMQINGLHFVFPATEKYISRFDAIPQSVPPSPIASPHNLGPGRLRGRRGEQREQGQDAKQAESVLRWVGFTYVHPLYPSEFLENVSSFSSIEGRQSGKQGDQADPKGTKGSGRQRAKQGGGAGEPGGAGGGSTLGNKWSMERCKDYYIILRQTYSSCTYDQLEQG